MRTYCIERVKKKGDRQRSIIEAVRNLKLYEDKTKSFPRKGRARRRGGLMFLLMRELVDWLFRDAKTRLPSCCGISLQATVGAGRRPIPH